MDAKPIKRRGALPDNLQSGPMAQQEFLSELTEQLGLTQRELAARLGTPWRTFEKWMYAADRDDYRDMAGSIWVLGHEILAHEKLKVAHQRLKAKVTPATRKAAPAETPWWGKKHKKGLT